MNWGGPQPQITCSFYHRTKCKVVSISATRQAVRLRRSNRQSSTTSSSAMGATSTWTWEASLGCHHLSCMSLRAARSGCGCSPSLPAAATCASGAWSMSGCACLARGGVAGHGTLNQVRVRVCVVCVCFGGEGGERNSRGMKRVDGIVYARMGKGTATWQGVHVHAPAPAPLLAVWVMDIEAPTCRFGRTVPQCARTCRFASTMRATTEPPASNESLQLCSPSTMHGRTSLWGMTCGPSTRTTISSSACSSLSRGQSLQVHQIRHVMARALVFVFSGCADPTSSLDI